MQWNEEAEEIMRERFGGDNEMALAAHLRQAFASWIDNGHNDFSDENTIILQVRVTDALLLSHGRRFEK